MPNYRRYIQYHWQKRRGQGLPRDVYYALYHLGNKPLTIIDVGGHRGDFTASVNRSFNIQRAIVLEPQPDLAAQLRRRFNAPWCTILESAVSNKASTMEMEVSTHASATASLLPIKNKLPELANLNLSERKSIRVDVNTIDDVLHPLHIDAIDLLKIDIQGNELRALKGAPKTLAVTTYIYSEMSLRPLYDDSCLMHDVVDHLRSRDFQLIDISPEFRSPQGELLQVNGLFRRRNHERGGL